MKDIGEKLKRTREEAGLSLEEVADDLKISLKNLQNLEDGNKEAFKDVYDLKYCIMDYAKYLGLDYEKLMEEFNEFIFDYTSRIPIAQIEQASKEKEQTEKRIVSPYTIIGKRNSKNILIAIGVVVLLILITCAILIMSSNGNNSSTDIAALM